MSKFLKIFVGISNPIKIKAVEDVFSNVFSHYSILVYGIKVSSEISNQPIGLESTIRGAINWANNALKMGFNIHHDDYDLEKNNISALGIEEALYKSHQQFLDI